MNVKKININQSEHVYDITSDIGYLYVGVATPTTDPGTLDSKVVYFANTAGTYTYFDNITVEENKVVALCNIDGSWESHEIANINITTDNIVDGAVTVDKLQDKLKEIVESVTYVENPEFLSVKTDADGRVLWWIEKDGSVNWVKGVPQPIQVKLQELEQKIKDNSYDDKPLSDRISANEADIVSINEALIKKVDGETLDNYKVEVTEALDNKVDGEYIENHEFARVVVDSNDRIIDYTDKNGKRWIHDLHADNIIESFIEIEDVEGRVTINTDNEGKVLSWRDSKGILHEEKGVAAENISINHISLSSSAANDVSEALKTIGFTGYVPIDWSEKSFINIPQLPICAVLNISNITSMPTTKTTNAKMVVEVWDMKGNYFKKKCIGNAQGDTSINHPKKNFALDFCEDEWIGDETTTIKIGPWVSQDSFHFKSFYTSITKAECPIGYKIYEKILKTKPFHKRAPYMEYYEGDYTTNNSPSDDLSQNMQSQARCYPDGFPCIVYLNGTFYGIFSWQLKKHRDNMAMGRNETDHIHLDGFLDGNNMWNGNVNWKLVEVRNPKPKSSKWTLLCQDGSEYDNDAPKEIMGEESEYYDSKNKSCVNSAKTKNALISSTNYLSEIKVFEDAYKSDSTEENLNTLKYEIEKRFAVDWMIDYVLLMNLIQDYDSISKNIQWATWGYKDGTLKWFALPYDLDSAFGVNSTVGFSFSAPTASTIGKDSQSPIRLVWDYYLNDIVSRYKELRENNTISYSSIMDLFVKWLQAIGFDLYEKEYEKWIETPCNRNSNISSLWQPTCSRYSTYSSSLTSFMPSYSYNKGAFTSVNGRCYKSLQNNNIGHNPINSLEWWEDVHIKAGTYSKGSKIFDGKTNYYQFVALEDVVVDEDLNNRPFTAFYSQYPFEGGCYDSIYRISKWISDKIEIMDSQFV